jgi:hypothetical protein
MATPLKVSDILRFLTAKGAKLQCTACGAKSFGYVDEQKEQVHLAVLGFRFPAHDVFNAGMYDVVLFACNNCSAVRLHMRQPIVEWAAANPPH